MTEQKQPSPKTVYRVLRFLGDGGGTSLDPQEDVGPHDERWIDLGTVEAHGPTSAIKELAGETEGTYVATPDRSWNVLRVDVKRETKVSVSPLSERVGAQGEAQ